MDPCKYWQYVKKFLAFSFVCHWKHGIRKHALYWHSYVCVCFIAELFPLSIFLTYSNWVTHVITLTAYTFGRCKVIVVPELQFHSRIWAYANEMAATRLRFTQLLSNNTHLINAYASRHPLRIEAKQFHNQHNSKNQIKSWHPLATRIYCKYWFDC